MRARLRFVYLQLLLVFILSSGVAADAQRGTILDIARGDGRLRTFSASIDAVNLTTLLSSHGSYTVFAPTDAAFEAMPQTVRDAFLQNPTLLRQTILFHVVPGVMDSAAVAEVGSLRTAVGQTFTVASVEGTVVLRSAARVTEADIQASNGVVHIIDVALIPEFAYGVAPAVPNAVLGQSAADGGGQPPADVPAITWGTAPLPNDETVMWPVDNPVYQGGGYMSYAQGIQAESRTCKGVTWVLLRQTNGVTQVGSDRQTNPYRGDTSCNEALPLLCFLRDGTAAPPHVGSYNFSQNWAGGTVRMSAPIVGSRLDSLATANTICQSLFGSGWQLLEFHDGHNGLGGWHLWANGGVEKGTRFWIYINDQSANPWNSVQAVVPPMREANVVDILWPGQDPAFVGGGRMYYTEGTAGGRTICKGQTWVVHLQENGLVLVGADRFSNPYHGDTSCDEARRVLCIKVDSFPVPPSTVHYNYSDGWSGGQVRLSQPITGHEINARAKANAVCQNAFGNDWRMATFHDGNLGSDGGGGWRLWAYGGLHTGERFWVSVNDQPANPWNPWVS